MDLLHKSLHLGKGKEKYFIYAPCFKKEGI